MPTPKAHIPPPRLWVIVARDAPIAAVFRRGPSKQWQIFKWNLAEPSIEPGGFLRGSMDLELCDLSPDGRLLGYLLEPFAISCVLVGMPRSDD